MTGGLFELAIVILIAAVLGFVLNLFRQPLLLAYLATGLAVGYFNFFNAQDSEAFHIFAELGIMFLLFLVGLEINYTSLKIVGRAAATVGVARVVLTSLIGFGLAFLLGFDPVTAAYFGLALSFSSTIIVIKLLSEKRDLNSLYGRIAVGILLIEDFIAIIALVLLSGIETGAGWSWMELGLTLAKAMGLFALMLWLGRKIFPFIFGRVARSHELLFLFSLAWVFILAALVSRIGFSVEIAGFLAGIALANSAEHFQIAARIRPLRDFFLLIFFVILGSSVVVTSFDGLLLPIFVFAGFVLFVNPLIILMVMGFLHYKKRTSLLTGFAVSQISEFSLVLAAVGLKLGHLDRDAVSIITAAGIATMVISPYLIMHGDAIAKRLSGFLALFERARTRRERKEEERFHKPIILIGAHRTGQNLAFSLPREDLLIIDFDPEVIMEVKRHGYDCIFGDVLDPEVVERANFEEAKLVISTSPDINDNLALLAEMSAKSPRPQIIVRAESEEDAGELYARGADYVLLPHFTSGQYLGKTISVDPDANILKHLRQKDLEVMRKRHQIHLGPSA